jgi:hypothetical protein
MAAGTVELADLSPIKVEDAEAFRTAAEHAQVKAAPYYFPRLYFYGLSRTHALRWERYAGSILIYQIRRRKVGSQVNSRMNLFLPPFPFDPAALRHAMQRMRDFNGDRSGRIIFVEESQALRIAREGFEISFRSEEFIYDCGASRDCGKSYHAPSEQGWSRRAPTKWRISPPALLSRRPGGSVSSLRA